MYASSYFSLAKAPFVSPVLSVILPFALFLKGVGEVTLNLVIIWIISVAAGTEFAIERKFDSEGAWVWMSIC